MRNKKKTVPLKKEDKTFFLQFYEENKNYIYFIAHKYTTTPSDCDDLVQETALRLMNNLSSLRQLDRCRAAKYIALTVRTAHLDIQKRKRNEKLIFLENGALDELLTSKVYIQDFEQQLCASASVAQLKEELSVRDWAVIEGKYILGQSQEEIAEMVGISPDSVRMALHRAREKAKTILEKTYGEGGDA